MTAESEKPKRNGWKILWLIVVPLIAGFLLSLTIPQPAIGVIYFRDEIYGSSADDLITQIRYAYDHPQIKAVLIVIDSPGGTVTDTEAVYMEMSRLREKKPIVMMVQGMAASGAYYMASATDYIIAEPSALVGNVGVIRSMPYAPSITEDLYSTGPYKLWGGPGNTFVHEMDLMKQAFLSAIKLGRGSRLAAADEVILRGQIWPGSEALKLGLIDELGSQSRAINKTGELAKIAHFKIINLREASGLPEVFYYSYGQSSDQTPGQNSTRHEGFYYLYVSTAEKMP